MNKKELAKYKKLSKESALERFKIKYPDLDIDKVKVKCSGEREGNILCETTITIPKQESTFGDSW